MIQIHVIACIEDVKKCTYLLIPDTHTLHAQKHPPFQVLSAWLRAFTRSPSVSDNFVSFALTLPVEFKIRERTIPSPIGRAHLIAAQGRIQVGG